MPEELIDEDAEYEDKLPKLLNDHELVKLLRTKSEIPPGIGIGGFKDGCAPPMCNLLLSHVQSKAANVDSNSSVYSVLVCIKSMVL